MDVGWLPRGAFVGVEQEPQTVDAQDYRHGLTPIMMQSVPLPSRELTDRPHLLNPGIIGHLTVSVW